jgi:hypothetical protein
MGNLTSQEPSGPLQACNGTALPLPLRQHPIRRKNLRSCFVMKRTEKTALEVAIKIREIILK